MSREPLEVREKRLELAELEAGKGHTDPALYEVLYRSLADDLAELTKAMAFPTSPSTAVTPIPKTTPAPISVQPPSVKQPEITMANKKAANMTEQQLEAKRAYQRKWHAKQKAKLTPTVDPEPRLERPMEASIDLGRAIERHKQTPTRSEDIRAQLKSVRRSVWMLMAELENLNAAQLADLGTDLALLDAAAHSAYQLSLGRLEVA